MKDERLYKLRIWMFGAGVVIFFTAGIIEACHEGIVWSQVCFFLSLLLGIYFVFSFLIYKLEKNFEEIRKLLDKKKDPQT